MLYDPLDGGIKNTEDNLRRGKKKKKIAADQQVAKGEMQLLDVQKNLQDEKDQPYAGKSGEHKLRRLRPEYWLS
jgi:hypothetical protein